MWGFGSSNFVCAANQAHDFPWLVANGLISVVDLMPTA